MVSPKADSVKIGAGNGVRVAGAMQKKTLEAVFREICSAEAPLRERLEAFSRAVQELGLPFAEAYDDLAARLKAIQAVLVQAIF
jgi:hypothetical protein